MFTLITEPNIFKFSRLSETAVVDRLQYIGEKEKIKVDTDALNAIIYLSEGDMRAAINLLQAASSGGGKVTEQTVYSISGKANPGMESPSCAWLRKEEIF